MSMGIGSREHGEEHDILTRDDDNNDDDNNNDDDDDSDNRYGHGNRRERA